MGLAELQKVNLVWGGGKVGMERNGYPVIGMCTVQLAPDRFF
jgi:hypothetical protein